jgi:hypothetical protein
MYKISGYGGKERWVQRRGREKEMRQREGGGKGKVGAKGRWGKWEVG